jgi:D-sedoheptulose 7-phosphate isomerase
MTSGKTTGLSMSSITNAQSYFSVLAQTVDRLPYAVIDRVADVLLQAHENGRGVYLFGNGGSAALASHLACDLGKGTVNGHPKRFRVIAFTDNVPLMTAWANDARYEDIFAEQLKNFVRPRDVVFAISGSGNSPNVLNALRVARREGAINIGLTGFHGGLLRGLCDICMIVPSDNMQVIEDLHLSIAHALFTSIRQKLVDYSTMTA